MAEGSPFAGLSVPPTDEAAVELREGEPVSKLVLRGDAADPAFLTAVEKSLGLALPGKVGQGAEAAGVALLCLGPDEWLVLGPGELAGGLVVTDVSAAWAMLHLGGERAPDVLAKGCPLDFAGLAVGDGRESQLGHVHFIARRCQQGFDLLFRRSQARAAWAWLVDAAGEYGVRWTALGDQDGSISAASGASSAE